MYVYFILYTDPGNNSYKYKTSNFIFILSSPRRTPKNQYTNFSMFGLIAK